MTTNYNKELEDFLKSYNADAFERPIGLTSDIAVFTILSKENSEGKQFKELNILLIKRKEMPYKGMWALPGGFVHKDEGATVSAKRELEEETGVDSIHFKQIGTYDKIGRDPRGWISSSAYYALVNESYLEKRKASDDAEDVQLFPFKDALKLDLGFDHRQIILDAYKLIKSDMINSTIAKEFLNEEFTLAELYKILLTVATESEVGIEENFYRKAKSLPFLEQVFDKDGNPKKAQSKNKKAKRKSRLFRFNNNEGFSSIYK